MGEFQSYSAQYDALTVKCNMSGPDALAAVKQNGDSLQYVREQTEDICLAAVKQNGDSLRYVREQTEDICLAAVKQNGYSLRYVREQTEDICLAAVKQNGDSLQYVRESMFGVRVRFDEIDIVISSQSAAALRAALK
jgi:hypothetical protein